MIPRDDGADIAVSFQDQPLGRVKLAIPRWRLVLGRPAGLAALTVAIGLLTFAYLRSRVGIDGWVVGTLVAGAIAAGLGIRSMVAAAGTGELLVFHDRLVIDNRYVFKEPIAIPNHLIRTIVLDTSPGDRRFPVRSAPVFAAVFDEAPPTRELSQHNDAPFAPALLNVPDHLYTPENALLLPSVSEPNDVPNLAVLFREPVAMRPLRLQPGYVIRGRFPSSSEPEWGFWARAREPEIARHTLSFVGTTRDLEADDVLPLLPRLQVLPAMRKRQILLVAFFMGLAAIRVAGEFWPGADTSPAPVSESDHCDEGQRLVEEILALPGKPSSPKGRATTRAIAQVAPPENYQVAEGAFGALDDVAASRDGHVGEWRVRLKALDFVTAYRQIWTSGPQAINVEVTEFEEYPAAVDYLSWQLLYGCSSNEIFTVPGVTGAVGREADDGNGGRVMFVYFARGGRTISVSHWNREGDADRNLAFAIARQTAALAGSRSLEPSS